MMPIGRKRRNREAAEAEGEGQQILDSGRKGAQEGGKEESDRGTDSQGKGRIGSCRVDIVAKKQKKTESEEKQRCKMLAQLTKIHECVLERGVGKDLSIANFGWLGVLVPRTAMIRTFAPKTGIQITEYDTLALPPEWGEDFLGLPQSQQKGSGDEFESAFDSSDGQSEGDDYNQDYDFGEYGDFKDELDAGYGMDDDDPYGEYGGLDDYDMDDEEEKFDYTSDGQQVTARPGRYENRFDYKKGKKRRGRGRGDDSDDDDGDNETDEGPQRGPNYWEAYRGVNVGYQFDRDMRWNDKISEGWNPIRKTSSQYKEFQDMKQHAEDLPFKDHSKYYDNPLEF